MPHMAMSDSGAKSVYIACPKHNEIITNGLWNFYQTNHALDLEFEWAGDVFRGHRIILELFISLDKLHQRGALLSQKQSRVSHSAEPTSESTNDVESVFEFLYRGSMTVSEDRLEKILHLAKEFNIQMLIEAIEKRGNVAMETEDVQETVTSGVLTRGAANSLRSVASRIKTILPIQTSSTFAEHGEIVIKDRVNSNETQQIVSESRVSGSGDDNSSDDSFHLESGSKNSKPDRQLRSRQVNRKTRSHSVIRANQDQVAPIRRRKKATLQRCERCGYETVRWTQFRLHLATHDSSIEVFRCDTCSRRFLSGDLLARHRLKHNPAAASTVLTKPDRRALWRQKPVLRKCDRCAYKTMRLTQFKLHQATHDPSIKIFRCETCYRRFLSSDLLARHRLKHSSNQAESEANEQVDRRTLWREKATLKRCEHCDYKTFRKSQFELHAAKHDSSIRVFRCAKCVRSRFLTEDALERHRLTHAGEPDLYECSQCDYKSANSYWFQVHVAGHDPNAAVLKCDVCYRRFVSAEKLQRHKESSHAVEPEIHHCPHCKFASQNKRSYQQHLIIIHQLNSKGQKVPKRFKCDECDYSCVYGGELKYHVTTKHRTEKPFKCELCPYASSRKGDVGQHVKATHLNLKPHLCETCGQRCASQSSLEQHKRSHTGEKPFNCSFCSKAFSDRYSMKKHARLHTSNERPYVCHVCGNSFNRRDNLKVHLRNVHKTQMETDALK